MAEPVSAMGGLAMDNLIPTLHAGQQASQVRLDSVNLQHSPT